MLAGVKCDTPSATRIGLLAQPGGAVVAYGRVAEQQPKSLGDIRVQVPTRSRIVVRIDEVLCPTAAAPLYRLPDSHIDSSHTRNRTQCWTLGELQVASASAPTFLLVSQLSHLIYDY